MVKKSIIFISRQSKIFGSDGKKVYQHGQFLYKQICKHTKRQPYIRSMYFKKEKIFLNLFWEHLHQKHWADRIRRIRYFACGIDLLQHSTVAPTIIFNVQKPNEQLYRFTGQTRDGELFFVQIKEQRKTKRKFLMSIFPKAK